MPAFSAGLSLKTPTMSGRPSFGRVDPHADPDVLARQAIVRAARSSGVMNEVWPVSPTASVSPLMAP